MSLMGNIVKFTGKAVGKTAEFGIKATGEVISSVAISMDKPELAKTSKKISEGLGEFIGTTGELAGTGLGYGLDKAIDHGTFAGQNIGGYIADAVGADKDQVKLAKTVGAIAGGGAVGFITGDLIGNAVMGVTALTGISSTGTAISTLSGAAAHNATIAAIGGGAISAGGGGIAAGQAILQSIEVVGTVIGGLEGGSKNILENRNEVPLLENNKDYINTYFSVKED